MEFTTKQLQRQLGLARHEAAWTMLQKLPRATVRPERVASAVGEGSMVVSSVHQLLAAEQGSH